MLVDPDAPGIEREELPMRWREGARQFQLSFNDVETPLDELVGTEGQGLSTLWPFTHIERLLTAALAIGNARHCITRALARAGERTIFGERPIGAEQAIQHPLASLHARLEATRLLVYRAAAQFDAGANMLEVAGEANMAKLLSADLLFDSSRPHDADARRAAWDEREGMIDLYPGCTRSAVGSDLPGAGAELHRAARAGPAEPPLITRSRRCASRATNRSSKIDGGAKRCEPVHAAVNDEPP